MGGEKSGQSLIRTPKQFILVALGFVVPAFLIALGAYLLVSGGGTGGDDSSALDASAVAARIKPVAEVAIAEAGGGETKTAQSAEQVVQQYCVACHATGAAGAPKIGDSGAWAKRIGTGLDQMLKIAIAGKGAMPARGGAANLSDDELSGAIVYMANQSGGKLKAPAAPGGPQAERSGEQVVQAACIRCHGTGVSGAPRIGDRTAWSQRISQGVDAVTKSAIRGHGNMPARGGLADLTDQEVTRAILYMFSRAGADEAAAAASK